MDDLLRAYAKKRRAGAGAPAQLHPATRRLLQSEVARLRPGQRQAPTSWLTALRLFWPRAAVVAAIVAFVGLAAAIFLPRAGREEDPIQLAKQDAATSSANGTAVEEKLGLSRAAIPAAPAPATTPMSEGAIAVATDAKAVPPSRQEAVSPADRTSTAERELAEAPKKFKSVDLAVSQRPASTPAASAGGAPRVDAPAPPAVALPPAEPLPQVAQLAEARDKDGRSLGGTLSATRKSPAVAMDSLTVADAGRVNDLELSKAEKTRIQPLSPISQTVYFSKANADPKPTENDSNGQRRFAVPQTANRVAQTRAATGYSDRSVLANFVLEQNGDQLRVVDEDGSIYEGKFLSGAAAGQAGDALDQLKDSVALAGKEVPQQQPEAKPVVNNQAAYGSPASTWNFRLTGTNRTLNQPITVDGVLFESVTNDTLDQPGVSRANESTLAQSDLATQARLQQNRPGLAAAPAPNTLRYQLKQSYNTQSVSVSNALRIQGSYQIGTTTSLPFDAVRDVKQP